MFRLNPGLRVRLTCSVLLLGVSGPAALFAQDEDVAIVGKQPILRTELDARTSAKLDAQQVAYEAQLRELQLNQARARDSYREHQLDEMVDERVLGLESAAKKTTSEALLDGLAVPAVSDIQVHAFYDAQNGQFGEPFEKVAARIRDHLEKQEKDVAKRRYLDSLRAQYKAVVLMEPAREIVAADGHTRGPHNAPITIVEFSDFQCPYCRRFEPVLTNVLAQYPRQVRLIYRNMPLTQIHPDAEKAAEASVCAGYQDKFWEFHDLMFQDQSFLSPDALKDKAKILGLNTQSFDKCLNSDATRQVVENDAKAAESLAVNSTPTIFVNGRIVRGVVTEETLSSIIKDELARQSRTAAAQFGSRPTANLSGK